MVEPAPVTPTLFSPGEPTAPSLTETENSPLLFPGGSMISFIADGGAGLVLITVRVAESPDVVAAIFGACTLSAPEVLFRCDAPEFTDTGIDGLNAGGVTTAISGLSLFSAVSVGAGSAFTFRLICVGFAAAALNCKGAFGASSGFPNMMLGNFRSFVIFRSGGDEG
jgi:hypothetical protein